MGSSGSVSTGAGVSAAGWAVGDSSSGAGAGAAGGGTGGSASGLEPAPQAVSTPSARSTASSGIVRLSFIVASCSWGLETTVRAPGNRSGSPV